MDQDYQTIHSIHLLHTVHHVHRIATAKFQVSLPLPVRETSVAILVYYEHGAMISVTISPLPRWGSLLPIRSLGNSEWLRDTLVPTVQGYRGTEGTLPIWYMDLGSIDEGYRVPQPPITILPRSHVGCLREPQYPSIPLQGNRHPTCTRYPIDATYTCKV